MSGKILAVTADEYHADKVSDQPSLSASIIKALCSESPLHAWTAHPKLNPNYEREEKEAFDLGTVAHALMLQGLKNAIVLDIPDWRKPEAREARAMARAEGKIAILRKHWTRVQDMVQSGKLQLAMHREAADAFTDEGKAEQTLTWTDDHGVQCKARMDWIRNDYTRCYDYKGTGTSINPFVISPRFVTSQGWDIQAAFYLRGIKAVTGVDAEFFFVAQEDYAPYALAAFGLHPETLIYGEKKVQFGIDQWAKCMESGKWPAYTNKMIVQLGFDEWDAERWAWRESQ